MKKSFFYTVALLLAGTMMTACSGGDDVTSDVPPVPQPAAEAGDVVVLSGTLGGKSSTTRAVDSDGNGTWEVGDKFAIYYETSNGHASAVATVNSVNDDDGSANFKATLQSPKLGNNSVKLVYPATAHDGKGGFKTDGLMSQNGTLDYVNENGLDIETAAATMNVEGTTATLSSDVQMQPQVCIYTFNLKDFNSDISATKLEITAGTDSYTITPTESTNKLTVALKPVSNADFTFAATAIGRLYTKQSVKLTNCTADNVGDVFDKDGNIYNVTNGVEVIYSATFSGKTLEAGKFYSQNLTLNGGITPVAMIAYVGDKGTADTSEGAGDFRGLAIAMQDAADNGKMAFRWGGYYTHSQSAPPCTYRNSSIASHCDFSDMKGINNTTVLATGTCGHNDHSAAKAAKNYSVSGFTPSTIGCSDWFLPSSGQWFKFIQACGVSLSNWKSWGSNPNGTTDGGLVWNKLDNAGANFNKKHYWWSSSECVLAQAVYLSFSSYVWVYTCSKDLSYVGDITRDLRVRAFIAF